MQARRHLTLLVLDFPRRDRCSEGSFEPTVNAFIRAAHSTGARAAVVSTLPETLPEHRALQLIQAGIVPLLGLEEAMAAIAAAAQCGEFARELSPPPWPAHVPARAARLLSEAQAKRRLAACGLQVPDGEVVSGVEAAVEAAIRVGFPVALKSAAAIAHKTEIGGVKLHLRDALAVRDAAMQLAHSGAEFLVERMITDAIGELIVGFNHDAVFGWHLTLGSGGVLVNLVDDACVLHAPASREEILAAIRALKVGALLAGYRGRQAGDIDAAADAVLAMQGLVYAERERLIELEVNPLIVRPMGCGAATADALMRIGEPAHA